MFFTIRALSVFSLERRDLLNERLLRFSQSEKLTSMGIRAAGIAHEINNPLTKVSLNLEMLRDLVDINDNKISRKINAIERNISRASDIAKELLHFSRDQETEFALTDINQVVTSACNLLHNQKLGSIVRLELQKVPKIMGISWKLEEVFINLLINSLDACSPGDTIEVETFVDDDRVVVMLTDTGHGIREGRLFFISSLFQAAVRHIW